MTNLELKADIDSAITSETNPNTVSPVDIGGKMKAIVDYVDQQCVYRTIKVSLTNAEVTNLFTVPKQLLPAVVGKLYIPEKVLVKFKNNAGWSLGGGNFKFFLSDLSVGTFASQMGGSATKEQLAYLLIGNPSNTTDSYFNKAVTFTCTTATGVPVDDAATLDVYLTYSEISI